MKWTGVITGDIVGSTKILKTGWRDKLLEVMTKTAEDLNRKPLYQGVQLEINRGDEFQLMVGNPAKTLSTAILMRAMLIASSDRITRWDARIGIGIGEVEFMETSLSRSDGEAFHMSGLIFDGLSKSCRLDIATPNVDFNEELSVSTPFADDIISNWTPRQAEIYSVLSEKNRTQKEISVLLGTSPQTISKSAITSKTDLITNYITRFESKIETIIKNPQTPPLP